MLDQKQYGDYLVLEQIDETITGKTFVAQHYLTQEKCFLKVLPVYLTNNKHFIERLQEIGSKLIACSHPYLFPIHTISCIENMYLIVSKKIEAIVPLKLYIENHLLSEESIFCILHQLAEVCDYVHAQGIPFCGLHLDHVYIQENSLHVYLKDVGVYAALGAFTMAIKSMEEVLDGYHEHEDEAKFAQQFLESYAFLPPELKKHQISEYADVFAFGICAYYMLTKQYPEGNFTKPSRFVEGQKYRWDWLIDETLHYDYTRRPLSLVDAIGQIALPLHLGVRAQEIKEEPISLDKVRAFSVAPSIYDERSPVVTEYSPQKKRVLAADPLLTTMVLIKGGTYIRGCCGGKRDEMPEHEVDLEPFLLAIHPVTNEQFVRFLEYLGGDKDEDYNDVLRLKDSRIHRSVGRFFIEPGYERHPVVGITWYGANGYAKWVGCRLPTEAEWEVAARSGKRDRTYPTGSAIDRRIANFFNSDTTAVSSYPPNEWGFYDLAGNVYEWCADWYSYNYYEVSSVEPYEPKGPSQGVYRVLRGGCWKSLAEDVRCAHRHRNNPGTTNSTYGFRCAKDVEEN